MAAAVLSVSRGARAPLATASSKVSLNLRWVALKTAISLARSISSRVLISSARLPNRQPRTRPSMSLAAFCQ